MGVLRHRCDLDLLVFFVRHPRTLMASEQLAAFLGYPLKQISDSLDILLGAGLLTRTPNPVHAARMYVFAVPGSNGGWLPELMKLASTQNGRQMLRSEMKQRPRSSASGFEARSDRGEARRGRRTGPFLVPELRNAEPRRRREGRG